MKKILVILIISLLIPACVFAGDWFHISLGATGQYGRGLGLTIDDIKAKDTSHLKDFKNYKFGPELRLQLSFVEIDIGALLSGNGAPKEEKFFNKVDYAGYGRVGFSFSLLGFMRLGFGAGVDLGYFPMTEEPLPKFQMGAIDEERLELIESLGGPSLGSVALTAPYHLKASLDFIFAKKVDLGVTAVLPTNLSTATFSKLSEWKAAYGKLKFDWKQTTLSLYLGYNFM